jgi:response regulator RpfG family c-di-GMP phosphodiesterase
MNESVDVNVLLKHSQNDTIRALLRALDLHGPGEAEHADRVAVYSVATAEAMGLSDEVLEDVQKAALLHDIGKIAIDRSLLRKLGDLTDADLALLRKHAEMCEEVLIDLPWLENAVPYVRHHHERFDGGGYPDGLAGDAIPIGARIIAVAETYDHLAYGTHYRPPVGTELATHVLRLESGKQFDPVVVEAFLSIEGKVDPLTSIS